MHDNQQTFASGGSHTIRGPEDIELGEVISVETRATVPVVTIRVPDPSAIPSKTRIDMRIEAANAYRREHATDTPVGVDVLPTED